MRAFLIKLLPIHLKTKIKSLMRQIDTYCVFILFRLGRGYGLYYAVVSRFTNQQRASIAGRVAFSTFVKQSNARSGFLRRHIHRLEKGLLMHPRKEVFALDYIGTTLDMFAQCLADNAISDNERDWAFAVLTEYFAVVNKNHPVLRPFHIKFESVSEQYNLVYSDAIPYASAKRTSHSVTYNQLNELCQYRRSVRYFDDKPVEQDKLEQAITLAAQAPSACNRQSFKFISFNTPKDAQRIGAIAAGTAGFAHQFQSVLVLVGDLSAYPFEKDRHVIYIDGALASMQLMLALETLGLSSCPINWADEPVGEKHMQEALQLPSFQRVIMLIAVGYAKDDGMIAYSAKRPVTELLDQR